MEIRYLDNFDKFSSDILKIIDLNERLLFSNADPIYPTLNTIEIETINRCNNDCSFCPVSRKNDIRKLQKMSEHLFFKIIDDLAAVNYAGYLSIFSNNEPLIDKRIIDFIRYAKKKCPNAIHALFTNGMLLNEENFNELITNLDLLFIDNYNDDLEIADNISRLAKEYDVSSNECEVIILVRKKDEVLLNRGGLAPNKKCEKNEVYSSPCILPFIQMVIRPDGKVSRCCQDAYGNMTLGNLNENQINDVFYGNEYLKFRDDLMNYKRSTIPFCNVCDELGLINYYPQLWNRIFVDSFIRVLKKKVSERNVCFVDFSNEYVLKKIKEKFTDGELSNDDKKDFYVVLDYNEQIISEFNTKNYVVGEDYCICESKWFYGDGNINKSNYKAARIRINYAIKEQHCIVFGRGEFSKRIIEEYPLGIDYFIDNNNISDFMNKRVFNVNQVQLPPNAWYVLAMRDYEKPYVQLIENGIDEDRIIIGRHLYIE